jgi:ribose transport system ATP-binding protein
MFQYALEMEGIYKYFSGVKVLEDVSLRVKKGQVHALVGGNGAGKSTLMKILTGVYNCDAGSIKVNGKKVRINDPNDAKKLGINMIYQELSLIPTLTVAENIFLTNEPRKIRGVIDTKKMLIRSKQLLESLDINVNPDATVSSLGVGYCQLIEIAKALSEEANILIMDEPTASLSESETATLFNLVRRLKEKGISIIYISHRMNEIFEVADEITVLRDGRNIITDEAGNFTMEKVIEHIIGTNVDKAFEWKDRNYKGDDSNLLEVKGLEVNSRIKDISFVLRKGEVLGIAGLMGSGRTEIVEAIFGITKKLKGDIVIEGKRVKIGNVSDAIKAGIALVPEDRRLQGLILTHTVKDNITLSFIKKLKKVLFIDNKRANSIVSDSIKELRIKTESMNKETRLLSGGNQQKVVFAKWLKTAPKVLLLDQPTAGVDIGAKGEIIDIIRKFADTGRGVVLISSELAELLAVCDRILVLNKGKVSGELYRKDIKSEEVLQSAIQK